MAAMTPVLRLTATMLCAPLNRAVALDLADITVSNDGSRTEEELGFPGV